jgi:hypothetical protein
MGIKLLLRKCGGGTQTFLLTTERRYFGCGGGWCHSASSPLASGAVRRGTVILQNHCIRSRSPVCSVCALRSYEGDGRRSKSSWVLTSSSSLLPNSSMSRRPHSHSRCGSEAVDCSVQQANFISFPGGGEKRKNYTERRILG